MPAEFEKPIKMRWDGEVFQPASPFWSRIANNILVAGQDYMLVERHERDQSSHRHYFAALREVWKNLPDKLALQFESPEVLRRHALIMAGYFNERKLICESRDAALRTYRFLQADLGVGKAAREQGYAIYSLNGAVLVERRAQSQSHRAMGKKRFMESKWDVLNWCADLIGVDVETLHKNAEAAA